MLEGLRQGLAELVLGAYRVESHARPESGGGPSHSKTLRRYHGAFAS